MVLGIAMGLAGLGTSIYEGIQGRKDAKRAKAEQEKYIQGALDQYGLGMEQLEEGYSSATPYLNQLMEKALSMESDLLGQIDPVTSREMRRIQQERAMAESQMSQQLTQRGLDSFTTRMGQQANIRGQAQNAISELGARMAAQRMGAITQGRGAAMSALGGRANFEMGYGQSRAANYAQRAGILGGVQVQPPQSSNLGGSLMGLGASIYNSSVLSDAMAASGPSGD